MYLLHLARTDSQWESMGTCQGHALVLQYFVEIVVRLPLVYFFF